MIGLGRRPSRAAFGGHLRVTGHRAGRSPIHDFKQPESWPRRVVSRAEALIQIPARMRGGGSAPRATRSSAHEARGEPSGLKGTPALRRSRPWRFFGSRHSQVHRPRAPPQPGAWPAESPSLLRGVNHPLHAGRHALLGLRDRSGDAPRLSKTGINLLQFRFVVNTRNAICMRRRVGKGAVNAPGLSRERRSAVPTRSQYCAINRWARRVKARLSPPYSSRQFDKQVM